VYLVEYAGQSEMNRPKNRERSKSSAPWDVEMELIVPMRVPVDRRTNEMTKLRNRPASWTRYQAGADADACIAHPTISALDHLRCLCLAAYASSTQTPDFALQQMATAATQHVEPRTEPGNHRRSNPPRSSRASSKPARARARTQEVFGPSASSPADPPRKHRIMHPRRRIAQLRSAPRKLSPFVTYQPMNAQ
jgi:hypothetical protein